MKVSWILWSIVTALISVAFILASLFIWTRTIDGAGAIQTPEVKLVSFIVLLFVFAIPFFAQIVWALINIIIARRTKHSAQLEG